MRLLTALALTGPALTACESDETACTPVGAAGAAPSVVALVENDTRGGLADLTNGGEVHLWRPLQGGHVLYVGARVTGLCADDVMITGRIKDLRTGTVISEETRRGFQFIDSGDGTATSDPQDLGAVANVALCPEATETFNVMGTAFELELRVEDIDGRVARGSVTVTPMCAQSADADRRACECECQLSSSVSGCG